MAFDEALAERIRRTLPPRPGITEKKMFGGLAFLLDGKMFLGIVKDELMARVGPDRFEEALAKPHVRPMDFTGRPMAGYVFVAPTGCKTDKAVAMWCAWSADFVTTLKDKPRPARRSRKGTRTRR